ncbi:MAG TPA: Ig-like domain-containing protein [Eggerthellaceae bacterium]|nr:Ig-like domain-containing protein [Eggerthellaceae bacterium]
MGKRISVLFMSLFLFCLLFLPSFAFAEESSNEDVNVFFSSDKSEYSVGDIATFSLKITNTGQHDITSSNFSVELPSGMQAINLFDLKRDLDTLPSGDSESFEIRAQVVSPLLVDQIDNTSDNSESRILDQNGDLPATGDDAFLYVLLFFILVAGGVGVVASAKTRHFLLSALLTVGVVGTFTVSASQYAFADDFHKSLSVSQNVIISGVSKNATVTFNYSLSSSNNPDEGETPDGIVYQDGVKVFSENEWNNLSDDLLSAVITADNAGGIKIGDILALEPSNVHPDGAAIVVEEVVVSDEGVKVSGSQATYEQLIKSINISGESSEVINFIPEEGITVLSDQAVSRMAKSNESGSYPLEALNVEIAEGCSVSLSPSIIYNINIEGSDVNSFDVAANCEASFNLNYSDSTSFLNKKLGEMTISTGTPITIGVDLYVNMTASGEVEINAVASSRAGVTYSSDNGLSPYVDNTDFSYSASFDAELKAGIRTDVILGIFYIDLIDFGPEFGGVVHGALLQRAPDFVCADMSAWFYADIVVGESEGTLINLCGISDRFNVLDENNSPKWNKHVENGIEVPECTWKEQEESWDPGSDTYIPELEDNGYGEEPILENLTGPTSYYNKLVEPFNVNAGHSVSIGDGSLSSAVAIAYSCDPGTVFRLIKKDSTGTVLSEETEAFVGSGRPWHGDYVWEIEVLCGRVTVREIIAWEPPIVSLGTCDAIAYPLHISKTSLNMQIGEKSKLECANDFQSILGEDPGFILEWSTSDPDVVEVDENGNLTAIGVGKATITLTYGLGIEYERTCEVVVE